MRIILDAMGGDNAPQATVEGAARAVKELGIEVMLSGDEAKIKAAAAELGVTLDGITVLHTEEIITMEDQPTDVIKSKKNCSMAKGLQALADGEGDAFVSAGNSGALLVGATMIPRPIKGVKRAAMAPLLPTAKGHAILLDGGANTECKPDMLVKFGIMGSIYMEKVMGIKTPRVGLINNGSEECKGRELEVETYERLTAERENGLNFVGNIEGRDIPSGEAEVLVTDGFTGNIVLKLYEGLGKFFAGKMKEMFSGAGKIGALFMMDKITDFKDTFDYKKVGGAVLLGIRKPVIKAHGSSDGEAFFNALRQAKRCVDGRVCETIAESVAARKQSESKEEA
ncbi:MAG: phosphate acyltransferase PlsX [Oscillospiraceae bacterium]|nr:phosphate acyltransferase PlsX [Oscillospiraceae bacterium]